jgi:hypothetical protein
VARGHDEALLRPTRGDHPAHAGVMEKGGVGGGGGGGGIGGIGSGSVRWLCHSRDDVWGAELKAGHLRRVCSEAEQEAMRTRDVRKVLGGIGGDHAHDMNGGGGGDGGAAGGARGGVGDDGDDGGGGGGGAGGPGGRGGIRSVVLDTEEIEGSLWRFVCGGGPASLAGPGAHTMKVKSKFSKAKFKMSKGDIKAAARAKAQNGGWADDDPGVFPPAAAAAAEVAEANDRLVGLPGCHSRVSDWCYMDRTGCRQIACVLTAKKNVVKSGIQPLPAGAESVSRAVVPRALRGFARGCGGAAVQLVGSTRRPAEDGGAGLL